MAPRSNVRHGERQPLLDEERRTRGDDHDDDNDRRHVISFDQDDSENPLNWSFSFKVLTTVVFSLTTLGCTFTSSVFASAQDRVAEEYGISKLVATLGTSLYVGAYAFGPLLFAPASEFLGRKRPLIFGYALFAASQIIVATARGPAAIFVGRAIGGYFSSAPLGIMSGAMSDIWDHEQRGIAIAIFSSVNFIGPVAGPIVGSYIVTNYDWHNIEWLVFAYAATLTILDALFLRESMADVILKDRAKKMRSRPGADQNLIAPLEEKEFTFSYIASTYLSRPSKMLATDPIIQCFAFFTAYTFGILYLSFVAFPIEFKQVRGWSAIDAALPNVGIIVGVLFGLALAIWWQWTRYNPALRENDGKPLPELRLPLLVVGAALLPLGLLVFGIAAPADVPWPWTVLGITLIGGGIYLVFFPSLNFLVDTFKHMTASAVAANTVVRSLFGAAFPLLGQKLFDQVGVQKGMYILAGIATLLLPLSIVFVKKGHAIRQRSKFAPT